MTYLGVPWGDIPRVYLRGPHTGGPQGLIRVYLRVLKGVYNGVYPRVLKGVYNGGYPGC